MTQKTDNIRGLGQLKNFNKKGQLISTLMSTFYEASAAKEKDRRWRRSRGDSTEDHAESQGEGTWRRLLWMTPRSTSVSSFRRRACGRPACCSASFLRRESVILRVHAAGGGERGRPVGTSEQRDRASDLLRKESKCCCRNGSGLLRRVSEWCRKEKIETSNNIVHL
jgi:hypothetical protein